MLVLEAVVGGHPDPSATRLHREQAIPL